MATFYQAGDCVDYTPGSAVTAGDIVQVGTLVGVALNDIAANELGSLQVKGCFAVTKAGGGGVTFAAGAPVEWSGSTAVAAGTSGAYDIGRAAYAAADADTTVYVLLNEQDTGAANA